MLHLFEGKTFCKTQQNCNVFSSLFFQFSFLENNWKAQATNVISSLSLSLFLISLSLYPNRQWLNYSLVASIWSRRWWICYPLIISIWSRWRWFQRNSALMGFQYLVMRISLVTGWGWVASRVGQTSENTEGNRFQFHFVNLQKIVDLCIFLWNKLISFVY